jgi:hypothetical protein
LENGKQKAEDGITPLLDNYFQMISYPKYPLKGGLIKYERLLNIMQGY